MNPSLTIGLFSGYKLAKCSSFKSPRRVINVWETWRRSLWYNRKKIFSGYSSLFFRMELDHPWKVGIHMHIHLLLRNKIPLRLPVLHFVRRNHLRWRIYVIKFEGKWQKRKTANRLAYCLRTLNYLGINCTISIGASGSMVLIFF